MKTTPKLYRLVLNVLVGGKTYRVVLDKKLRGRVWRLEAVGEIRQQNFIEITGKKGSAEIVALARDLMVREARRGDFGGL